MTGLYHPTWTDESDELTALHTEALRDDADDAVEATVEEIYSDTTDDLVIGFDITYPDGTTETEWIDGYEPVTWYPTADGGYAWDDGSPLLW